MKPTPQKKFVQTKLTVQGSIIFQLVPINPHEFRTISCAVIQLLYKHAGKLF
jgi:hypothetical protein